MKVHEGCDITQDLFLSAGHPNAAEAMKAYRAIANKWVVFFIMFKCNETMLRDDYLNSTLGLNCFIIIK